MGGRQMEVRYSMVCPMIYGGSWSVNRSRHFHTRQNPVIFVNLAVVVLARDADLNDDQHVFALSLKHLEIGAEIRSRPTGEDGVAGGLEVRDLVLDAVHVPA